MQHPDEHILSAYALGSLDMNRRGSIQKHLRGCHGCRTQVEELLSVYKFTEERAVEKDAVESATSSQALAPAHGSVSGQRHYRSIRLSARVGGSVQWFVNTVRKHPLVTGAGTLAFGMLAFFAVNLVHTRAISEPEPAFTRINATHSAIDVYDRGNVRLWEIPFQWNMGFEGVFDLTSQTSLTETSGFLGNGKTQVLTATPFLREGRITRNVVRAFDNRGVSLWEKNIGRNVSFRGEQYLSYYGIASLATVASPGRPGMRDIFVGTSDDRSPSAVVRVGADSLTIGEYWHFGHVPYALAGSLAGRAKDVIFVCGINDLADRVDSSYPAIVVLDPAGIVGRTESTVTPGFGYAASRAELFYVRADQPRLPIPASTTVGKAGFRVLKIGQDSSVTFVSRSGTLDGRPYVEYTFDSHMKLVSVWLDDASRRTLTEQILGSEAAVELYLRKLRRAVRYWDGRSWRSGWTQVRHDPDAT